MRLLFITHYFHPEVGAPQTRILESASLLDARGHDITVLTGFPNYPDGIVPAPYRRRLLQIEWLDGIKVIRSAIYPAPNRGFARRLLNHASFALSGILASAKVGRIDAVIAETPPLFTAVASVVIARARGAPLILNVSDLWPESAIQLGALANPTAIRVAEALERFSYANASAIAVPWPGMRRTLIDRGQPVDKVVQIPNAVEVERFAVPAAEGGSLVRIVYCGTVGMAQGVGTLIEAARELSAAGQPYSFRIVGDGAERADLEDRARALALDRVTFAGRVTREQIPDVVGSADIAVMSLRDLPLFEDALPTKLLEYMAAGKPIVAAATGQVARVVEEAQCGVACQPENPSALAAAIRRLAADPEQARRMGLNGRRYVEANLSRRASVERLERVVAQAVRGHGDGARSVA